MLIAWKLTDPSGRTACWVPYPETGYTKGKKTGVEKDGKIEVERLVDGKVKMFKERVKLWKNINKNILQSAENHESENVW